MSYKFIATSDYINSEQKIKTLISFAIKEERKGRDDNRVLFLKLAVVLLVTRFQVYIERVLDEFNYELKNTNKINSQLPLHLRLYSIKLHSERKAIQAELKDPTTFNLDKLQLVKSMVTLLNEFCDDGIAIHPELKIDTKFPLEKQGLNELKSLFKQIEGKDIFENAKFDINKLNEILNRRHNIIHEDANDQLTELKVKEYKVFIVGVVKFIDKYLAKIFK
jgi:hypothetical protein